MAEPRECEVTVKGPDGKSRTFLKFKNYYDTGKVTLYNLGMITCRKFGITPEEFEEITGKKYVITDYDK